MTNNRDGAVELALTIIHDGAGYLRRKQLGEQTIAAADAFTVRYRARDWFNVAMDGARKYERDFGTPNEASCFRVEDILGAAIELADYYERHAKEAAALADLT